jgi:hypothetical protein
MIRPSYFSSRNVSAARNPANDDPTMTTVFNSLTP